MVLLGSLALIWSFILIIQLVFGLTKNIVSVKIGLLIIAAVIIIPFSIGFLIVIIGSRIENFIHGIYGWIICSLILNGYFSYYLFNEKTPTINSKR